MSLVMYLGGGDKSARIASEARQPHTARALREGVPGERQALHRQGQDQHSASHARPAVPANTHLQGKL